MESKWRINVSDLAGAAVTTQLIARILAGIHTGKLLVKVSNTIAAVVPFPPLPGVLPTPTTILHLTSASRFPYGFTVEADH